MNGWLRLNLLVDESGTLFALTSDDVQGLMLIGNSLSELEERLPNALEQLTAAEPS